MVYFSRNYNELTFPWLRGFTPSDVSEPIKETKRSPGRPDEPITDSGPPMPHLSSCRVLGLGSPAVRDPTEAGHFCAVISLWGGRLPCLNFDRARLSERRVGRRGEGRGCFDCL